MSNLSTIRTMQDLEHQRALLQLKAAHEEQRVRQDLADVKSDYMPVVNGIQSLRHGVSKVKLLAPFLMPVVRFIWNKYKTRKS